MTPPRSHPDSEQAYRDYVESVEEAPPMETVYLAKIVAVIRENGEFVPVTLGQHVVVVGDHAFRPETESNARSRIETLVGGAEK